jgi:hypothetical protein
VWTKISTKSRWVREEADEALNQGKYIPVRLDDVTVPLGFRRIQVADLVSWDRNETSSDLLQVLKDIREHIGSSFAKVKARQGTEVEEQHRTEGARDRADQYKRRGAEGEGGQTRGEQHQLGRKGWLLRAVVFGALAVLTGVFGFNLFLIDDEHLPPVARPESGTLPVLPTRCEDANLERHDLTGLILAGKNCFRVNLRNSNLRGVDLTRTSLVDADLSGADLSRAILDGATMTRANLKGAILARARLDGADLRGVKNLTQEQLDEACGDDQTRLSGNLSIGACE